MTDQLFIGSNGHVCAIDRATGQELWRTKLQQGMLKATHYADVSVIVREGTVYAGSQGHLFAINSENGQILWHNELPSLGYNDISLAFEGVSVQYIQKVERQSSGTSAS
jgi:outer membrane protein assembly factor BamB